MGDGREEPFRAGLSAGSGMDANGAVFTRRERDDRYVRTVQTLQKCEKLLLIGSHAFGRKQGDGNAARGFVRRKIRAKHVKTDSRA